MASCASLPPRPPPEDAERARRATSYSASLRVGLRGPELRGRTAALVAFRRPDRLRIEVPGPAGARLIAVTAGGRLAAVFPGDRAVFEGGAAAADLEALLGVSLAPEEVMDLLVGAPGARLRDYHAGWKDGLPRRIHAVLPDGAKLDVTVLEAEVDAALPDAAFAPPPHAGYRRVEAGEVPSLWQQGSRR
ncbi:MAG TPA: hypothetical protein VGQ78_02950 [Vicinamibacteria bacterium]|nr:hypothetical protein [Vicinamibacteria bacterium]